VLLVVLLEQVLLVWGGLVRQARSPQAAIAVWGRVRARAPDAVGFWAARCEALPVLYGLLLRNCKGTVV